MHSAFKQYHKQAVLLTTAPITVLNSIFRASGRDLRILSRHDDIDAHYPPMNCSDNISEHREATHFGKISSKSTENTPHTVIASEILDIRILNWRWDSSGDYVEILYRQGDKR